MIADTFHHAQPARSGQVVRIGAAEGGVLFAAIDGAAFRPHATGDHEIDIEHWTALLDAFARAQATAVLL